jgi:hypothetical protein
MGEAFGWYNTLVLSSFQGGDVFQNTTSATHDLDGVRKLVILGWCGGHELVEHQDSGNRHVEVEVPARNVGEFWRFGNVRNGVLTCSTNMLSSPSVRTRRVHGVLKVHLPADKLDSITVEVRE